MLRTITSYIFRTISFYISVIIAFIIITVEQLIKKFISICVRFAIFYFILILGLKYLATKL